MIVNQKTLSQCIGITTRRIREMREDGFFPNAENGKGYHLEKCVKEYIDYKIKAETGKGTYVQKEVIQAQHEVVKKDISMLKLRKMRGELHEAVDIEIFLTDMLLSFRNKLLSFPQKIAMQIVGESEVNKIIETLNREIEDTLAQLAEYGMDDIGTDIGDVSYLEEEDEDD